MSNDRTEELAAQLSKHNDFDSVSSTGHKRKKPKGTIKKKRRKQMLEALAK